jgi:hypothetical protein
MTKTFFSDRTPEEIAEYYAENRRQIAELKAQEELEKSNKEVEAEYTDLVENVLLQDEIGEL